MGPCFFGLLLHLSPCLGLSCAGAICFPGPLASPCAHWSWGSCLAGQHRVAPGSLLLWHQAILSAGAEASPTPVQAAGKPPWLGLALLPGLTLLQLCVVHSSLALAALFQDPTSLLHMEPAEKEVSPLQGTQLSSIQAWGRAAAGERAQCELAKGSAAFLGAFFCAEKCQEVAWRSPH